jgi:hypothetical protein
MLQKTADLGNLSRIETSIWRNLGPPWGFD